MKIEIRKIVLNLEDGLIYLKYRFEKNKNPGQMNYLPL